MKNRLHAQELAAIVLSAAMLGACAANNPVKSVSPAASDTGSASASSETRMDGATLESLAKYSTFYKPDSAWVGDTMPIYANGVYNIFYLNDARDGAAGYHAIYRFTTKDFANFTDNGVAVPYGGYDDDDLAIGTGCVYPVGDKYYCYYTGVNDHYTDRAKTVIMRAVSTDGMKTFVKDKKFRLYAPTPVYSMNDWRDPQIVYDSADGQYWMLIAAKKGSDAVVARYVSRDAVSWTQTSDLYTSYKYDMLECPNLTKIGNYWYLVYSEYANNETHYVYGASMNGPWQVPANDQADGRCFYAGKIATDGKNAYIVGWSGTRKGQQNDGNFEWAGNMVAHQVVQNADGSLGFAMPAGIAVKYSKKLGAAGDAFGFGGWSYKNGTVILGGQSSNTAFIHDMSFSTRMSADLTFSKDADDFGIVLGADAKGRSGLYFRFDAQNKEYRFDTADSADYLTKEPTAYQYLTFTPGKSYHLDLVTEGSMAVLYVDGQEALTARMYAIAQGNLGLFCSSGKATFSNVAFYRKG